MSTGSYLARRAIYQSQHHDEPGGSRTIQQSPAFQSRSDACGDAAREAKFGEALPAKTDGKDTPGLERLIQKSDN